MSATNPGAETVRLHDVSATDRTREEAAAFERVYVETRADLLAYVNRRTSGSPAEAADLLAQVYLVAWRRRDVLPSGDGRRPWLFGIARVVLAEHHRTRTDHVSLDELGGHESGRQGGDVAADPVRAAVVRRALAGLAEMDRELLLLTIWDGLSSVEAAQVLGISPGAARVRLHRARRRLRTHPDIAALMD